MHDFIPTMKKPLKNGHTLDDKFRAAPAGLVFYKIF